LACRREHAAPVVAPEAARLVVQHLERGRPDLVDAIDAAADPEGQPLSEINGHGLRLRQRLGFVVERTAKRHFEADGRRG
jgi:hypothetical protein